MFSFDTNLDDGGADMTGTKGAESGFVGDVDAEEEAVDNEFEGLGRYNCNFLNDCTFDNLLCQKKIKRSRKSSRPEENIQPGYMHVHTTAPGSYCHSSSSGEAVHRRRGLLATSSETE